MTTLTKPSLMPDVSTFFSDMFDEDLWPSRYMGNQYKLPATNVIENENNFSIELAAPGLTKQDFNIDVNNGILMISSEKKEEKEDKKKNYTRREFSYRSFARSFSLPDTVDADKIKANYDNGLLKLLLPKKEASKMQTKRKITIN